MLDLLFSPLGILQRMSEYFRIIIPLAVKAFKSHLKLILKNDCLNLKNFGLI